MVNKIIKLNDKVYVVNRILSSSTSDEDATKIHNLLGTDTLLRDKEGKWFCCISVKDAEFRDVDPTRPIVISSPPSPEDYGHYGFELQDNGGMG